MPSGGGTFDTPLQVLGALTPSSVPSPGKIQVEVLPPISTEGLEISDVTELTDRCYTLMRETFFRLSGRPQEVNGVAPNLAQ